LGGGGGRDEDQARQGPCDPAIHGVDPEAVKAGF